MVSQGKDEIQSIFFLRPESQIAPKQGGVILIITTDLDLLWMQMGTNNGEVIFKNDKYYTRFRTSADELYVFGLLD